MHFMPTDLMTWLEFLSYVATVVGIPLALGVFIFEEKKERQAEQEEIYDKLMEHYTRIQERLFAHPEIDTHEAPLSDPEDARRQMIVYQMLISLFERSFILLYGEEDPAYQRMWNSWEDYMNEWISRPNFRAALPRLMLGEDPDFVAYMARASGMDLKP
jgi:hypothetical protein